MRLLTVITCALLLAACGSASPAATPQGTSPAASTPQGTSPAATTPPAQTASPIHASPTATAGGSATSPPGGGVTGPAFSGPLNLAIPPVIGGEQVQVVGPVSVTEMENLDDALLELIDDLGVDPASAEVVFGHSESVIIFAVRLPGVDSAAIDSGFIAAQQAAPGTSNFRVVTVAGRNVHAYDTIIGTQYAWVNGDILFTVFGDEQGAQQAIAAMPLPTVALQAGGEVLADAVVDLTISGGPNAGTYRGETSSGGCSRNALGENTFGLQYTDDANAQGFTSFQLVVRDAAAAEAGGTDDFFGSIQIGPAFGGTPLELRPKDGDGEGTVTIDAPDNDSATVRVVGTTADGTAIDATITCNVVFEFGGG